MAYELGIDVGTTFIGAAIRRDGTTSSLALGQRSQVAPSAVLLGADGTFLVGDAAERAAVDAPERLARLFKRRFGDATPIVLGGVAVPVDRLVSEVVRWVVGLATAQEGEIPAALALTHPAKWGGHRLEAFRTAAASAYAGPVRLVSEPEAAAAHYVATRRPPARLVVFDLGGGTFDVAILGLDGGGGYRHLLEPEGIDDLGGVDVDEAVLAHVLAAAYLDLGTLGDEPSVLRDVAALRRTVTEAKEALSFDSRTAIDVRVGDHERELVTLTRQELEVAVRPQLGRSVTLVQRMLERLPPEPETVVLLTGGASRMPLVTELVTGETGLPCAVDADPKLAVALGALESSPTPTAAATTAPVAAAPQPEPLPEPMVAVGPSPAPRAPALDLPAPTSGPPRLPLLVGGLVVAVALVVAAVLALGGDGDGDEAADGFVRSTTTSDGSGSTETTTALSDLEPTPDDLGRATIADNWATTVATQADCEGFTDCEAENGDTVEPIFFAVDCPSPASCSVSLNPFNALVPEPAALTSTVEGAITTYRASGPLPVGFSQFTCSGEDAPTNFEISFHVTDARALDDDEWAATEIEGEFRAEMVSNPCGNASITTAFTAR